MTDYRTIERQLLENLGLARRPIAITFCDTPPSGVPKFVGSEPSGCSFWRVAASGKTFYTVPSDHYNCPIGSYTHNIPLPSDRAPELDATLGLMGSIGYVRMEEVPGIPRLAKTPGAIVYGPVGDTPVDPDVVLVWGPAAKIMLLQEAAVRAGGSPQLTVLPRPTCMALPAAMSMGMVASTACIGNRVYTGMDDGELYVAVPGKDVARVANETQTIALANAKLREYHQDRRQKLSTA
jgi:uncharacterized protein (DUF169 family)